MPDIRPHSFEYAPIGEILLTLFVWGSSVCLSLAIVISIAVLIGGVL
jgi:hypothetical protein